MLPSRSRLTALAALLLATGLTACAKDPMSPLTTNADDRKEPTLPWFDTQKAAEPTLPWFDVAKEPTLPWFDTQKAAEPTLPWF